MITMKTVHLAIGVFLLLAVLVIAGLYWQVSQKQSSSIIFYYGYNCPHCKIVEDYMSANNVNATLQIEWREVYNNTENRNALIKVWNQCGQTGDAQIPVFYYRNSCYVGQDDGIAFLKRMMEQKP